MTSRTLSFMGVLLCHHGLQRACREHGRGLGRNTCRLARQSALASGIGFASYAARKGPMKTQILTLANRMSSRQIRDQVSTRVWLALVALVLAGALVTMSHPAFAQPAQQGDRQVESKIVNINGELI